LTLDIGVEQIPLVSNKLDQNAQKHSSLMEIGKSSPPILITNNIENDIKSKNKDRRLVVSQHKDGK
jgi:hypothetical protein